MHLHNVLHIWISGSLGADIKANHRDPNGKWMSVLDVCFSSRSAGTLAPRFLVLRI